MVKKITKIVDPTILTDDQIKQLLDSGITSTQVKNLCKKGMTFDKMIPKANSKAKENEAREWLRIRLNGYWTDEVIAKRVDVTTATKNAKELKIPERKLPIIDLKNWILINDKQQLKLTMPMLPSENHMYQTSFSTGARQMTLITKKMFIDMQDYVLSEIRKQDWQPVYKTFVVADMNFYFPDAKMRDCHNTFKFLFDTMDGQVLDNDQYILPRVDRVTIDRVNPRIEITLSIQEPE